MNTALTRRESLWADEPVMRDGDAMDGAIKALQHSADAQSAVIAAIKSAKPDIWLGDAEAHAIELLQYIRSMRAVLK